MRRPRELVARRAFDLARSLGRPSSAAARSVSPRFWPLGGLSVTGVHLMTSVQNMRFDPPPSRGNPTRPESTTSHRGFAAVPHELSADARLKPLDVRLANILIRYARRDTACWPSIRRLADDLDRCERTVQ